MSAATTVLAPADAGGDMPSAEPPRSADVPAGEGQSFSTLLSESAPDLPDSPTVHSPTVPSDEQLEAGRSSVPDDARIPPVSGSPEPPPGRAAPGGPHSGTGSGRTTATAAASVGQGRVRTPSPSAPVPSVAATTPPQTAATVPTAPARAESGPAHAVAPDPGVAPDPPTTLESGTPLGVSASMPVTAWSPVAPDPVPSAGPGLSAPAPPQPGGGSSTGDAASGLAECTSGGWSQTVSLGAIPALRLVAERGPDRIGRLGFGTGAHRRVRTRAGGHGTGPHRSNGRRVRGRCAGRAG